MMVWVTMMLVDYDDVIDNDVGGGPLICGMDTHGMCHRCPK